jgi:hypothetical protein
MPDRDEVIPQDQMIDLKSTGKLTIVQRREKFLLVQPRVPES